MTKWTQIAILKVTPEASDLTTRAVTVGQDIVTSAGTGTWDGFMLLFGQSW